MVTDILWIKLPRPIVVGRLLSGIVGVEGVGAVVVGVAILRHGLFLLMLVCNTPATATLPDRV